jgi:hypothetical protein
VKSKAETLRLVLSGLLRPFEFAQFPPVGDDEPREADALWQVGHAGYDAARGLVSPFQGTGLETRFEDRFYGKRSREPWQGLRPAAQPVLAWWQELLSAAVHTLDTRELEQALPQPIAFTAYTVHSVGDAFDYVIYHSSFHLAVAQVRLGFV